MTVLECVPNFSEARRPHVIDRLLDAASSVPGARLLDVHSDVDHNRTVLTMAGETDPLQEAVFRTVAVAVTEIDLREHRGNHPRLGAADVVPFVPLAGSTMSDAVHAAHTVGRRVAEELGVPVYFYGEAALRPERQALETIRNRGFESMREKAGSGGAYTPDAGPTHLHATAGAVMVGARDPLIAYNIYLNTTDRTVAQAIARRVRYSTGGLRYVKALGIDIPARGQVQVSMNLTNYRGTSLQTVFELVRSEAASYGLSITDSEVVGLIPVEALVDVARFYLRLHHFSPRQILERRLEEDD